MSRFGRDLGAIQDDIEVAKILYEANESDVIDIMRQLKDRRANSGTGHQVNEEVVPG